jgi:hypothetical protein
MSIISVHLASVGLTTDRNHLSYLMVKRMKLQQSIVEVGTIDPPLKIFIERTCLDISTLTEEDSSGEEGRPQRKSLLSRVSKRGKGHSVSMNYSTICRRREH